MPPKWRADINTSALHAVVEKLTATSLGTPTLVTRGAYATIFLLSRKEGDIIVRAITRKQDTGRASKMESHVAAMKFIEENSDVPVPHVFGHDPDPHNTVGTGWIAMSYMAGSVLAGAWAHFDLDARCNVIRTLARVVIKLCSLSFQSIGGCYISSTRSPPYSIGPLNTIRAGMNARRLMDLDEGPWKSSMDFILALIRQEIKFLSIHQYAAARSYNRDFGTRMASRTSPIYRRQLESFAEFACLLLSTHGNQQSLSTFVMCHGDMNMDNILVREDGEVIGLIDFEFSGSYPLWYAVGAPDWFSNDWLDEKDRREHELEAMDLPDSCFSELEQLRSIYREEMAKGGEWIQRALEEGQELRLLLQAASSQWIQLPKIIRWMKRVRDEWDESRGAFTVHIPEIVEDFASDSEDNLPISYIGY